MARTAWVPNESTWSKKLYIYQIQLVVFEIFKIDDEVRHMVNENLSTPQLRRQAREIGMRTLREDGIRKVLNGMTSASEIIHVTMADAN